MKIENVFSSKAHTFQIPHPSSNFSTHTINEKSKTFPQDMSLMIVSSDKNWYEDFNRQK